MRYSLYDKMYENFVPLPTVNFYSYTRWYTTACHTMLLADYEMYSDLFIYLLLLHLMYLLVYYGLLYETLSIQVRCMRTVSPSIIASYLICLLACYNFYQSSHDEKGSRRLTLEERRD